MHSLQFWVKESMFFGHICVIFSWAFEPSKMWKLRNFPPIGHILILIISETLSMEVATKKEKRCVPSTWNYFVGPSPEWEPIICTPHVMRNSLHGNLGPTLSFTFRHLSLFASVVVFFGFFFAGVTRQSNAAMFFFFCETPSRARQEILSDVCAPSGFYSWSLRSGMRSMCFFF